MIDVEAIENEIAALEGEETTYETCEQLAWLYVVRDHVGSSRAVDPMPELHGTEFMEAVSGRSAAGVMRVLAEHMEAIRVVAPREYEKVLDRLRAV